MAEQVPTDIGKVEGAATGQGEQRKSDEGVGDDEGWDVVLVNKNVKCYACGRYGHYAKDKSKIGVPGKGKSKRKSKGKGTGGFGGGWTGKGKPKWGKVDGKGKGLGKGYQGACWNCAERDTNQPSGGFPNCTVG